MLNLPLTANVLFTHHFHGITFPPKIGCQKIWKVPKDQVAIVRNKKKYLSPEDALIEIKRIGKETVGVYQCPECGYWHIGNNKKK